MSDLSLQGLGPIDPSVMPKDVREGGPERQERFRAALAFERVLIGQITERLFTQTQGEGDEGGSAGVDLHRKQLPGALADALTSAGGLGLAAQLDASWQQGAAPTTTSLSKPNPGEAPA